MKQSEFVSTIDLAFEAAGKISHDIHVDKKHYSYAAEHALRNAIKENVVPGIAKAHHIPPPPAIPRRTFGSPTQQAIAINLAIKTVAKLEELPDSYEADDAEDVSVTESFKSHIQQAIINLKLVADIKEEEVLEEPKTDGDLTDYEKKNAGSSGDN